MAPSLTLKIISIMETIKSELKNHLATCIEFDGLGYDQPKQNTLKDAAKTLYDECIKNNQNELRKPLAKAFTHALQGLPSYINNPFTNWEIENLMYSLGDDTKNVDLYWNLCGEILADSYKETKQLQKV